MRRRKNIYTSFHFALQGVIYALRTQRNMKVHFLIGLLVIVLATALDISRLEMVVLFLTVGMVITAELINTAVESVVNLITEEYHPVARVAKNVAAGAVLVAAGMSVFVGYLIFVDKIIAIDEALFRKSYPSHYLIAMALATIVLTIIGIKAARGRDELLRGGMPSGHTAIAFSIATAIWYTTSGMAALAGFVIAALVGQSRVEGQIHSWAEVAAGALIGTVLTAVFFQL